MREPEGCLTKDEFLKLKKTPRDQRPRKRIFYVNKECGIIQPSRPASLGFVAPRTRYFHNYLLAYGYSLRLKQAKGKKI